MIYSVDPIKFDGKIYSLFLMELHGNHTRIGGESLQDALMNKDHTDYVSPLAKFYGEGIDCYIPDDILENGDSEAIEKAIRKVDPELFDDEPEDEPEELTWDDIYVAADGCACGEPNLKRKDFARHEIVCWAEENFGFNLEYEAEKNVIECVEDWLDAYAENFNLRFDAEGHLIRSSEVTLHDKASELVSFYDDRPDRPDKEFDTLDIALDILREMIGKTGRSFSNPELQKWYDFYCVLSLDRGISKSSFYRNKTDTYPIRNVPENKWLDTYKSAVASMFVAYPENNEKFPDIAKAVKEDKEKQKVIEAVSKFKAAYDEAEKVFSEYSGDINDIIARCYPFEKSFDEYALAIATWANSIRRD